MSSTNDIKPISEIKKKKRQKSLKNILTSPYNQYWSPIEKDDLRSVHEHLEKNLPALENLKSRISWKILKKLSKENRTKLLDEKKEKIKATASNKPLILMRRFLSIGLNESSRCVSQDELSCLLVDGGPQSKRIAVFLVNIALAKHTPVLICPGLLEITLGRFGFKSIAVGIKKTVNDSVEDTRKLLSLQECVISIFSKQLSTEPILCDRMKQILTEVKEKLRLSFENKVDMDESEDMENTLDTEPSVPKQNLRSVSEESLKKSRLEFPVVTLPDNIYRYRSDKSYRVYVPQSHSGVEATGSESFIAVGDEGPSQQIKKSVHKKRYMMSDELFFIDTGDLVKQAVVKKVKANPKRATGKVKGS